MSGNFDQKIRQARIRLNQARKKAGECDWPDMDFPRAARPNVPSRKALERGERNAIADIVFGKGESPHDRLEQLLGYFESERKHLPPARVVDIYGKVIDLFLIQGVCRTSQKVTEQKNRLRKHMLECFDGNLSDLASPLQGAKYLIALRKDYYLTEAILDKSLPWINANLVGMCPRSKQLLLDCFSALVARSSSAREAVYQKLKQSFLHDLRTSPLAHTARLATAIESFCVLEPEVAEALWQDPDIRTRTLEECTRESDRLRISRICTALHENRPNEMLPAIREVLKSQLQEKAIGSTLSASVLHYLRSMERPASPPRAIAGYAVEAVVGTPGYQVVVETCRDRSRFINSTPESGFLGYHLLRNRALNHAGFSVLHVPASFWFKPGTSQTARESALAEAISRLEDAKTHRTSVLGLNDYELPSQTGTGYLQK